MGISRVLAPAFLAFVCWACDGGTEASIGNPFQCLGLPRATCERLLADARQEFPGVPVVRAVIRCTVALCTEAQGEATMRVDFANGRFVDQSAGWMQAEPAPNPVPPVGQSPGAQPTSVP